MGMKHRTKGRPRGTKRIIFSQDKRIYYTEDHSPGLRQMLSDGVISEAESQQISDILGAV